MQGEKEEHFAHIPMQAQENFCGEGWHQRVERAQCQYR
jgi:hypothetical protein